MSKHFAVDLGAESGRCIVGILENGKLTLDELCRFPTQGLQICGEFKWNIYRFYEHIINGLKEYVKRFGNELDSIGVDTWGVDFGLLDKNKKLLGIPYTYRDTRTLGTLALLDDSKRDIYSATGIQFLEFNTLNQLIGARKLDDQAFIDPDDQSFFNPSDMAREICNYVSKSGGDEINKDDVGTIARIIFESLALKYNYVIKKICGVANKKVEKLHIVGGGSKNEMLNQFVSNAMNVIVTAGPTEGAAMGNLLMQAYGCKELNSLYDIRKVVRDSSEICEFLPQDTLEWEVAFNKFISVCKL